MSPGSGIKSEYMKRYREPRWDEFAACYRELRRYRLGRRLLEQAHAPWLWDAWGPSSSSDSSASSSPASASPAPPCSSAEPAEPAGQEEPERRDAEAGDPRVTGEPDAAQSALLVKDGEGKPEPEPRTKDTSDKPEPITKDTSDKSPSSIKPGQQPSALFALENKKSVRSPQRSSSQIKENKHPFALYGWGEKQMDTGNQKTHNVCASASVNEIHESALRAKNRRQVEKRKLAAQRQRAHSVDVDKSRKVKVSTENPWMTEYMRCYSARA
ncbi:PREDICTED: centriole, cilia and spindle-associated protein [Dipodomys ordii]|uniref:Centriole, cilia and spindle-associated protein n=1 Tax=Dipodomys ordii TaxID=10020 RepID=A0A1S3F1J8_DIPOR|nr:PREDICTED: centriole, cilia and spindle-associated protein [Dipodomys ordii]